MKVLEFSHKKGSGYYWTVICSCGKVRKAVSITGVKRHKGSCLCDRVAGRHLNLLGKVFGKAKVIAFDSVQGEFSFWKMKCDCGNVYVASSKKIKKNINGCGKHGRPFEVQGDYIKVDVSTKKYTNMYTLVDKDIHAKYMRESSWFCDKSGDGVFYVRGTFNKQRIRLHKLVLPAEEGFVIDHINGNTMDNTRGNLRAVTQGCNTKNASQSKSNRTGCTGVYLNIRGKYVASIQRQKKNIHLGTYNTLEEAAYARKVAEKLEGYHKNHGRLRNYNLKTGGKYGTK